MKIILSPAKSLTFEQCSSGETPRFIKEAHIIMNHLTSLSEQEVQQKMKTSEKLTEQTLKEYQSWGANSNRSGKALFSYSGEVFQKIDALTLSSKALSRADQSLYILSGLYGVLSPSDSIEPYRLEVKTSLPIAGSKSLYAFWKERVTKFFIDELSENELFINLASTEYSKMIGLKQIGGTHITPQFKIEKAGQLKSVAIWAKRARGYFVRFLLEQNPKTIDTLKEFNEAGFCFESYCQESGELLFVKQSI